MQYKTNKLHNRGLGARLGAFALFLASSTTAQSWIHLDSFPYTQNFDDSSYDSAIETDNLVWTTQGATHTWEASGGWGGGGAAKFTPPTGGEGYSGLGQIHFSADENGDYPTHLNVRFLIYHGPTWVEYAGGNKVIIMNRPVNENDVAQLSDSLVNRIIDDFRNNYPELSSREDFLDNDFGFDVNRRAFRRPMIISRQPGDYVAYGSCDNTVCNYNVHHNNQEPYWPDGNDQFRIGDSAIGVNSMGQVWEQVEEEWVSVEFEVDTVEGYIRTYIYTQSGRIAGEIVTKQMDYPGSTLKYIDILGGYMGQAIQAHPGNYFMIDNLAIDDSYIGPPAGFVDGDVSASNVYYATNPRLPSLSVMSLADNNTVTAGDRTLTLDLYERGEFYSPDERVIAPGMVISATGPLDMGSITPATDTPVHTSMMGRSFAMPHVRHQHNYHMLSPEQDASVEIMVDGTVHRRTLPRGELVSFNAGNSNSNVSAVITSDTPIAVSHSGQGETTTNTDAMPLPRAATELWGIRSRGAAVGATEDDTQVVVYASDGTTEHFTMQRGEKRVIRVGADSDASRQGAGSALHIVASNPVNAVQVGDGDGWDATAFYPTSLLNSRYGIPKDSQYVAIACPDSDTRISLYRANGQVEVQDCTAEGNHPGKAYFGISDSNGVSIPQESYLESNNPIHVIYEVSGSEDEHNLLGAPAM
jgi:hypothetical protein